MLCVRQIIFLLGGILALVVTALARPDSAGHYPDPPPGISHGGIPYGSVSGDVAAYYKNTAPSSRSVKYNNAPHVDFTPIEQWL